MRMVAVSGPSGSGKTTLLLKLLPLLTARGLKVSTVKQAHADFDIDKPGKDSHQHRVAGAREVMVASARRWALMHEYGDEPEWTMDTLAARMTPVDLVLVEGFKAWPVPRIAVHRPALGKPLAAQDDPHLVAIASDGPVAGVSVPVLDLNDAEAIAAFILSACGLAAP